MKNSFAYTTYVIITNMQLYQAYRVTNIEHAQTIKNDNDAFEKECCKAVKIDQWVHCLSKTLLSSPRSINMNSILLHGCLILIFFIDGENFGFTHLNLIYIEKTL